MIMTAAPNTLTAGPNMAPASTWMVESNSDNRQIGHLSLTTLKGSLNVVI